MGGLHLAFCYSAVGWLALATLGPILLADAQIASANDVHLEVLTTDAAASLAAHDWIGKLKQLPFASVRIQSGNEQSRPALTSSGSGAAWTLHVTGVLDGSGRIRLPGGIFAKSDISRLREWLVDLKSRSSDKQDARHAFDLPANQLVALTDQLKSPVSKATKGRAVLDVMRDLRRTADLPISVDESARAVVASESVVIDELQGVSVGTALSAVLRPLGLAVVPRTGDTLRLKIIDFRRTAEHWPVGWPRKDQPHELVPKLHEFLEVDISDVTLEDALAVIQSRLEIPFLYDHNGLARERIELAEIKVSFPPRRTFYSRILKNLLFQAKLRSEVRADELGQPFLWISPQRSPTKRSVAE